MSEVTLRPIIASIFSTSASSNGATDAVPALLTSMVMDSIIPQRGFHLPRDPLCH